MQNLSLEVLDKTNAIDERVSKIDTALQEFKVSIITLLCPLPYSRKILRGNKFGALAIWFEIVNI